MPVISNGRRSEMSPAEWVMDGDGGRDSVAVSRESASQPAKMAEPGRRQCAWPSGRKLRKIAKAALEVGHNVLAAWMLRRSYARCRISHGEGTTRCSLRACSFVNSAAPR